MFHNTEIRLRERTTLSKKFFVPSHQQVLTSVSRWYINEYIITRDFLFCMKLPGQATRDQTFLLSSTIINMECNVRTLSLSKLMGDGRTDGRTDTHGRTDMDGRTRTDTDNDGHGHGRTDTGACARAHAHTHREDERLHSLSYWQQSHCCDALLHHSQECKL
jgi:hypothetical protein